MKKGMVAQTMFVVIICTQTEGLWIFEDPLGISYTYLYP